MLNWEVCSSDRKVNKEVIRDTAAMVDLWGDDNFLCVHGQQNTSDYVKESLPSPHI